tara:strand:- start:342 stop:728 length:387 start_codon:yes stop_codon:yes gene_type:complete
MKTVSRAVGPYDPLEQAQKAVDESKSFEEKFGHLSPWCFSDEAMVITNLSEVTLQRRRTNGQLPKWHKNAGRIIYRRQDLHDWMMGNEPENSSDSSAPPEAIENRAQPENVKPSFSMRTGRASVRRDV